MAYRLLTDAVVTLHFGFLAYVIFGGFFALRWRATIRAHVVAALYGLGIVVIGWPCPLTALEQGFRERAGERGYSGGFIDHYLTGVLYPARFEGLARLLAAVVVLTSWALLFRKATRSDFRRAGIR